MTRSSLRATQLRVVTAHLAAVGLSLAGPSLAGLSLAGPSAVGVQVARLAAAMDPRLLCVRSCRRIFASRDAPPQWR